MKIWVSGGVDISSFLSVPGCRIRKKSALTELSENYKLVHDNLRIWEPCQIKVISAYGVSTLCQRS